MANVEKKSLEAPDDTRTFDKGRVEVVNIGGGSVGRYNFEPGGKGSDHVKPLAGTELCQSAHFAYQSTGRLHVEMAAGREFECGSGDASTIPAGREDGG